MVCLFRVEVMRRFSVKWLLARLLFGGAFRGFTTVSRFCFLFFHAAGIGLRSTSAAFAGVLLDATCAPMRSTSAALSSLLLLRIGATCTFLAPTSRAAREDKTKAGAGSQRTDTHTGQYLFDFIDFHKAISSYRFYRYFAPPPSAELSYCPVAVLSMRYDSIAAQHLCSI